MNDHDTFLDEELQRLVDQAVTRLQDIEKTAGEDTATRQEIRFNLVLGMTSEQKSDRGSPSPEIMAEEVRLVAQFFGIPIENFQSSVQDFSDELAEGIGGGGMSHGRDL